MAGLTGNSLELAGQPAAYPQPSTTIADVQEGELSDAGAKLRSHDPDPHEALAAEGSQRNAAAGEMSLALRTLMCDGVLALSVSFPGRGAPIGELFFEASAMLDVPALNSFRPIDHGKQSQFARPHAPIRDLIAFHPLSLARSREQRTRLLVAP
jgi:hypothetical protein